MKIPIIVAAFSFVAAGAFAAPLPAKFKGRELAGQASVTLVQARATALSARPGRITDQELEKEGGGSGLRYSFDIVSHGKTIEVGVDARTGKVLENAGESLAKEANEKD
jgi:uncharacterized membrane protein YkoI